MAGVRISDAGRRVNVILAMAVFVASHVAIARTGLKPWLVARLGERGYLVGYSLLSLALLGWVIVALLTAPRVALWSPPAWSWLFAGAVSALGFALIGIGAVAPNPLSVSFRSRGFDPAQPGVIGWTRHPLIWGLTLWAIAHLPGNGDWPAIVLFGGSALFGALGVRRVERRMRAREGDARWRTLTQARGHLDLNGIAGAALGLALWAALLVAHPALFGANPLLVIRAQLGLGP